VVEVEEDGAVKKEHGAEQTMDYSNDGTDVRFTTFFLFFHFFFSLSYLLVLCQWGEGEYGDEYYEEGGEEGQYEEGGEAYAGDDGPPQNIPPEIDPSVSDVFRDSSLLSTLSG
jgi:hypothetical protein